MSLSINQTPATCSLAQSPIIFSVFENTAVVSNTGFQYVADLYYWTGSLSASGSLPDYTMVKYPNTSFYGIFDLNRILNSTLQDLAQANQSNVVYFACDFFWQYLSGSQYVTGSHLKSDVYKALDGYSLFQEPIGQQVYSKTPHWPLMTDGPATQSALAENYGSASIFTGNAGTTPLPDRVFYSSSLNTSAFYFLSNTGSNNSNLQVDQYPIGPQESEFPFSPVGLDWFTVQAYSGSSTPIGQSIKFELVCKQKYPNIRIKWKNRYGQFDWFNFYMVNRQSFNTERRTYQPQLGSWSSPTLQYNNYDSSVLNYISDSKQAISVQTDWVDEAYNEIFKQLLVSDEIYWIYDEAANDLRPITINTQSIIFKTGVNDKVIQYGFDFNWGQSYKLII